MDQKELKALLTEASQSGCSGRRLNEIHCKLQDACCAVKKDGTYKETGRRAGMSLVLDKLYVDTIQNRQEILPVLFPAFAVICGDRKDNSLYADIDWALV